MTQAPLTERISPAQLRQRISSGAEYALIDPREVGEYSNRHLFFASCLPLSRMELLLASRLPRKDVPVTLVTGGEADVGLAERAAVILARGGYPKLSILAGGTDGWEADGGEIYSGVNVPSKAFGEFVEHWHDTPRLAPQDLLKRQASGEKMLILDSRPFDEFQRMSIPGGIDCPGAELVYRVQQVVPDPETTVIVNCAGRTRSIIGAQSLINAGLPNPVYALKDGTMGWKLAGLELCHGEAAVADPPEAGALVQARERAGAVADRCGVKSITPSELADWRADSSRTCYLLDVRTEQEYQAGHWPGAIHAPGGQLVQATDEYVMIRQSRLVLCDSEDGVRSAMTAHWLLQLGWPDVRCLTAQPEQPVVGSEQASQQWSDGVEPIAPGKLNNLLSDKKDDSDRTQVLDFSTSRQYRQAHLPGAMWALRARLQDCLARARSLRPGVAHWVVMADSDELAGLAAADLKALEPTATVSVLAGGMQAWQAAKLSATAEQAQWLTDADDVWPKPGEGQVDPRAAMEQYLSWEVGLVEQVEREGLARFRRLM